MSSPVDMQDSTPAPALRDPGHALHRTQQAGAGRGSIRSSREPSGAACIGSILA
jgi:hypothetical protein